MTVGRSTDVTGNSRGGSGNGILTSIAFGWFLTLGLRFLLPAILPQIKGTFTIDNTTAGIAITGIWVGYGLMQFPAGMLVDRLDERRLLSLSLVLAGVSLAVIGLAPIFTVFLLACVLFGLATGLFGTTRGIALSRFFHSNQGRAFGITLAAGSIGSAALPFLGGTVTEYVGWRLVVGSMVPLFLVTAVSTWMTIPSKSVGERDGVDPSVGNLLEMLGGIVTDRAIVIAFVGMTLLLFTFQALTSFLPTYLIQEKGLSQAAATGLFALLFVVGAGFHLVAGSATDRYGTRPVIVVIAFVGILTLGLLPLSSGVLPLTLLIVVMSSRVAVPSVLNPYIINHLPADARGSTWGLLRTLFFIISATGSTVVGTLSDHGFFDESFYLLAGLTAVAAALLLSLPKREGNSTGS